MATRVEAEAEKRGGRRVYIFIRCLLSEVIVAVTV